MSPKAKSLTSDGDTPLLLEQDEVDHGELEMPADAAALLSEAMSGTPKGAPSTPETGSERATGAGPSTATARARPAWARALTLPRASCRRGSST